MQKTYTKPALSFDEQIDQLIARGLVIDDRNRAIKYLTSISYYRLSAYWYSFRIRDSQNTLTDQLTPNTHFKDIIQLYEIDRQLRLLVIDAIERIEVAVRTQIAYHLAHTYNPFAHTNPDHFHPKFKHAEWLSKIEKEISRSNDEFIRHYQRKYIGFPIVPIWMLVEIMSLGNLSIFYSGLQHEDKKQIATHFNLHYKRLADWLHTLTYIRNVCAHHSRLWNRELAIRPDLTKDKEWRSPITPRNDRIFYILLILKYLLKATGNGDTWAQDCTKLLSPLATQETWRIAMGMPPKWQEHPLWQT